jgi:hypothetical protein
MCIRIRNFGKKSYFFAEVGISSFPPNLLIANVEKLRFLPFIKDKYANEKEAPITAVYTRSSVLFLIYGY